MRKLLLMSMLLATFVLPMRAARDPNAARGVRRTVISMAICVVLYVFGLLYVLPRLS